MITFGLLSSVFDYLTFGMLIYILHAGEGLFRTGWFIESVISASTVVLVVRSRRLFFKSKPSPYLLMITIVIACLTVALPYTPLGKLFGFARPSLTLVLLMISVVLIYVMTAELVKRLFYRRVSL
jgi:Mg2+-importing ATPase